MKIRSHKELRVWQEAMDLAMEVFALSRAFPSDERFSLTDQVRRSSRSVAANIAEAWRKRRYEAAFIAKLNDAEGEAAESQTHLEVALRCGYITSAVMAPLDARYEQLLAQLVTMSTQPEVWTVGANVNKPMVKQGDRETMRPVKSPSSPVAMSQSPSFPSNSSVVTPSPSPKVTTSSGHPRSPSPGPKVSKSS